MLGVRENNKPTKANNGEIHLFVVCMVILTVTLLYLEQCPAKSPLMILSNFTGQAEEK